MTRNNNIDEQFFTLPLTKHYRRLFMKLKDYLTRLLLILEWLILVFEISVEPNTSPYIYEIYDAITFIVMTSYIHFIKLLSALL